MLSGGNCQRHHAQMSLTTHAGKDSLGGWLQHVELVALKTPMPSQHAISVLGSKHTAALDPPLPTQHSCEGKQDEDPQQVDPAGEQPSEQHTSPAAQ